MNADLKVVRAINGVAGKHRTMDLALDAFTRTGHLTFVLYGLWMWFGPGKAWDKSRRRRSAMMALFSVGLASCVSMLIGKIWSRKRPFVRDWKIWNFTGHKANASFPSNHTMNSFVIVMQLYWDKMPGRHIMAIMASLLAFSRMFAGLHYPTDLLGGIGIAGLVNAAVNRSFVARGIAHVTVWISLLLDKIVAIIRKAR